MFSTRPPVTSHPIIRCSCLACCCFYGARLTICLLSRLSWCPTRLPTAGCACLPARRPMHLPACLPACAHPQKLWSQGYGGVLDSGTTFTYFPTAAFNSFVDLVDKAAKAKGLERRQGQDPQVSKSWVSLCLCPLFCHGAIPCLTGKLVVGLGLCLPSQVVVQHGAAAAAAPCNSASRNAGTASHGTAWGRMGHTYFL